MEADFSRGRRTFTTPCPLMVIIDAGLLGPYCPYWARRYPGRVAVNEYCPGRRPRNAKIPSLEETARARPDATPAVATSSSVAFEIGLFDPDSRTRPCSETAGDCTAEAAPAIRSGNANWRIFIDLRSM